MDIRPGRWQAWRWLASRAGLPPPGAGVSTVVVVRVTNGGEEWRRTFAEHAMMTTQRIEDGLILERFNGLEVRFKLRPERGALRFEQRGARLCLGALRVPLPRWLAPAVVAHEGPGDAPDRTRVEVRITLPLFGEILSYSGWMGPPEEAA